MGVPETAVKPGGNADGVLEFTLVLAIPLGSGEVVTWNTDEPAVGSTTATN